MTKEKKLEFIENKLWKAVDKLCKNYEEIYNKLSESKVEIEESKEILRALECKQHLDMPNFSNDDKK
jgi:hypothetical protein